MPKAVLVLDRRLTFDEVSFAEVIVWQVPEPVAGSVHRYKYRLAYVVDGECILRYDNETGKGDHRHLRGRESRLEFTSIDALIAAFMRDIERNRS